MQLNKQPVFLRCHVQVSDFRNLKLWMFIVAHI